MQFEIKKNWILFSTLLTATSLLCDTEEFKKCATCSSGPAYCSKCSHFAARQNSWSSVKLGDLFAQALATRPQSCLAGWTCTTSWSSPGPSSTSSCRWDQVIPQLRSKNPPSSCKDDQKGPKFYEFWRFSTRIRCSTLSWTMLFQFCIQLTIHILINKC